MAIKIGMQLGMMRGSYREALDQFNKLQQKFAFTSAELQLESTIYSAYYSRSDHVLPTVDVLGMHLPFMRLNPISPNDSERAKSLNIFRNAINDAADAGSAYVTFHARTQGSPPPAHIWKTVLSQLAVEAGERGLQFCLENADDLPDLACIHQILHELPEVCLCLDIGHLYEHTFNPLTRYLPLIYDRKLTHTINDMKDHIACVHIHNHDGFFAHQPLTMGKIDLTPIRDLQSLDIPLILESDYRSVPIVTLEQDINFLIELVA